MRVDHLLQQVFQHLAEGEHGILGGIYPDGLLQALILEEAVFDLADDQAIVIILNCHGWNCIQFRTTKEY
jgi:hypothetical protein